MSVPTGTQQVYGTIGVREDLSDMIYDLSPTETPFMSNVGRSKCTQPKFEWQSDSLAAADGDNAVIEGDDATTNTFSATTRIANYTQIMDKVVRVTGTNLATKAAGRKNELAYQVAKRSKEIKRDMETRLTGNYASTAGASAGGTASARMTAGFEAWITSNESNASSGGATLGSAGGYSAATGKVSAATDASSSAIRTFTEAMLKAVIKSAWDNGGEPNMVIVGSFNKQRISGGFAGISTEYNIVGKDTGKNMIVGAADLYVSDFGVFQIVPNRFSRGRSALVVDPKLWSVAYLRPFQIHDLAKTGDSERKLLNVEFGLCSKNQAGSGIVRDLTTS